MTIMERIFDNMATRGHEMYGGEAVTQLQHGLQCATLARRAGAGDRLVAAALLHDYGHLMGEDDAAAAAEGHDTLHEEIAANHLAAWFGPEVTEPIRMHVPAKRYLCAVDQAYFDTLSPASVQSLAVQGGAFTPEEAEVFMARPHAREAVELRRWDDRAKDPEAETDPLDSFRPTVEAALKA